MDDGTLRFDEASTILKTGLLASLGQDLPGLTFSNLGIFNQWHDTGEENSFRLVLTTADARVYEVRPVHMLGYTDAEVREGLVPFCEQRLREVLVGRPDPYPRLRRDLKNRLFGLLYGSHPEQTVSAADVLWGKLLRYNTPPIGKRYDQYLLPGGYKPGEIAPAFPSTQLAKGHFDYAAMEVRIMQHLATHRT